MRGAEASQMGGIWTAGFRAYSHSFWPTATAVCSFRSAAEVIVSMMHVKKEGIMSSQLSCTYYTPLPKDTAQTCKI